MWFISHWIPLAGILLVLEVEHKLKWRADKLAVHASPCSSVSTRRHPVVRVTAALSGVRVYAGRRHVCVCVCLRAFSTKICTRSSSSDCWSEKKHAWGESIRPYAYKAVLYSLCWSGNSLCVIKLQNNLGLQLLWRGARTLRRLTKYNAGDLRSAISSGIPHFLLFTNHSRLPIRQTRLSILVLCYLGLF